MKPRRKLLFLAVALSLSLTIPAPRAESQLYGECSDIYCTSSRPFSTVCRCTLDSARPRALSTCGNWPNDCWNGWPP